MADNSIFAGNIMPDLSNQGSIHDDDDDRASRDCETESLVIHRMYAKFPPKLLSCEKVGYLQDRKSTDLSCKS